MLLLKGASDEISFAGCDHTRFCRNTCTPIPCPLTSSHTGHVSPCLRIFSSFLFSLSFVVVQSLSRVRLFLTPWTAAHQASLSFTISQSLFELMSIESMMPSNHLILCCPFLLLPSIFLSNRFFPNESVLHIRWPKYWSFNFSITPSYECSWLISLRIDWFDLLAV